MAARVGISFLLTARTVAVAMVFVAISFNFTKNLSNCLAIAILLILCGLTDYFNIFLNFFTVKLACNKSMKLSNLFK